MLTDFRNTFTDRLSDKFATQRCLKIPPYVTYVATLPCEIWTSVNWQQSEICIVINDKSQGSIAKHLSWDGFLHYKCITQFASERIFKIDKHLAKLQAKWLIVSYAPFALLFCPQRCRTCPTNKITCVLWTETVTSCCYVIGRLMSAYYEQITNCCIPVLTCWLTDWRRQRLTNCDHVRHYAATSFSLSQQLCTVSRGIVIIMVVVNIFLLVN